MLTLVIHILYVCYTAFPFLYPTYRYILRPPVLVNSSTVFLQFQANRQNVDRFEAAYAFHDGTSSLFSDPSSSRDHSYITSAKILGGWVQKKAVFADVHYCIIYADICSGWVLNVQKWADII